MNRMNKLVMLICLLLAAPAFANEAIKDAPETLMVIQLRALAGECAVKNLIARGDARKADTDVAYRMAEKSAVACADVARDKEGVAKII